MGEIDWATVFGTLETADTGARGQSARPRRAAGDGEDSVPRSEQREHYHRHQSQHSFQHAHTNVNTNAEAGPSRPPPPNRSYSLPQGALDDQAFGMFAHDHASRAWFANNASAEGMVAGPSSHGLQQAAYRGAVDHFAIPAVPPSTPFPLVPLEQPQQYQQQSNQHPQTQFNTPWLFDNAIHPQSHQGSPVPGAHAFQTAVAGLSSGDEGIIPLSRPPSTPSSARPTPNTLLDQEDKRVRNTMACKHIQPGNITGVGTDRLQRPSSERKRNSRRKKRNGQ